MSENIPLILQVVNGDPAVSGSNINITSSTVEAAVAFEGGTVSLSSVEAGDSIEIGGLVYFYEFLGSHLVRGDPSQPAAYIRIVGPLPTGSALSVGDTFAIDLSGEPGDADYPNLQNGNTQGTVADLDTATPVQFPGFVCFAQGTLLDTPNGMIPIERIAPGDLVTTLDNGPLPVALVVSRSLEFEANEQKHKPIEFKPGSLGECVPTETLRVSPQHRMIIEVNGVQTFVAAKGLLHLPKVRQMSGCKRIVYYHLIFDTHQIVVANGALAESFFPGSQAISEIDRETKEELFEVFPQLQYMWQSPSDYIARPVIGPSKLQREYTRHRSTDHMGENFPIFR